MAKKKTSGFTAEEQAAARARARELRTAARRAAPSEAELEAEVLAKIAEMNEPDRGLAERLHALVMASAPELSPQTWYGMPAYGRGGKVVCFFQPAQKFKTRYATLGFSDRAKLDDGDMWPVCYALRDLTAAVEKQIAALLKQAAADRPEPG